MYCFKQLIPGKYCVLDLYRRFTHLFNSIKFLSSLVSRLRLWSSIFRVHAQTDWLFSSYIWPIFTYSCETWTLSSEIA